MTKKERNQLSEELDRHRGRWVAVRGTTVVAAAKTLKELDESDQTQPGDRRLAVPVRHHTTFKIRKAKDGSFYFVEVAKNGEILATSETYERMASALHGAQVAGAEGTVEYEGDADGST